MEYIDILKLDKDKLNNINRYAMNRLVGFTIGIGAQKIAKHEIDKRDLTYTAIDVLSELLLEEMKKRDVHVTSKISYL